MSLFSLLEISPVWDPFIDAIVRATCIFCVGALTAAALHRASAAARHLVWMTTLLAALALPLLSAALPEWTVPVLSVQQQHPADMPVAIADAPASADAPIAALASTRSTPAVGASTRERSATLLLSWAESIPWTTSAVLGYLAVTSVILLRLFAGIMAVRRVARRTEPADDAPWIALATSLAAELGIVRVTFRRSNGSTMPMTWGVLRPVVLMPAEADAWPEDRLRIVLLHELAHVKRADCLTHLLAQTTCAIYWINPLTWIAARRARAERERACDDLVLACGTPGADYAAQLLDVARIMRTGRLSNLAAGGSLAMAHRSQLEGRLMAILDPSLPRSTVSRVRTLAAGATALLLLAPLATIEPWVEVEAAVVPFRQATPPPTAAASPRAGADPCSRTGSRAK